MNETQQIIWKTFNIKRGDVLPYSGFGCKGKRDDFPGLFAALGYKRGAEVGVSEGRYSEQLIKGIPGLELYCVDPWTEYDRCSQRICDERYARAVRRLEPLGAHIIRKSSMEGALEFAPESLDFVFIDGDHRFDYVMQDIIEWSKRVRRGGVVSGHDFYKFYQAGVMPAVEAYTKGHNIQAWYVTREMEPSWLWVKP